MVDSPKKSKCINIVLKPFGGFIPFNIAPKNVNEQREIKGQNIGKMIST